MSKLNLSKGLIAVGLVLGLAPCLAIAEDAPVMTNPAASAEVPATAPATPAKPSKPKKAKAQNQQPANPPASNNPYAEEKVTDNPDPIDLNSD